MTKTFTDITNPNFRCTLGACPAVHRSEDGKTLRITGELYNPEGYCGLPPGIEAAVEISADLVLASLGVNDLVEAAQSLVNNLEAYEKKGIRGLTMPGEPVEDWHAMPIGAEKLFALRSVLNKIKGGA